MGDVERLQVVGSEVDSLTLQFRNWVDGVDTIAISGTAAEDMLEPGSSRRDSPSW